MAAVRTKKTFKGVVWTTGSDPLETLTLPEKMIKIGAKVIGHDRYITFQIAEIAVLRGLFRKIQRLIDDLRPKQAPT